VARPYCWLRSAVILIGGLAMPSTTMLTQVSLPSPPGVDASLAWMPVPSKRATMQVPGHAARRALGFV
jgi:hypothetical protein